MRRIVPPPAKKKYLPLQKGEYSKPTVWEPMGRSPGNTPQAQIQFIQTMMPIVLNPPIAQMMGIDLYEVGKAWLRNSPVANDKNIQKSKQDMQDEQQSAAAGMGVPGQPGQVPGLPPQPGGPPAPVPPPPGPQGVPGPPGMP